jgi:tetratricopeptide (TPR) repeat protein
MGLLDKFGDLLKMGNSHTEPKEKYFDLLKREPENGNAHLKLAEIYQRKGEKQKAVSEYLLAADIFTKNQLYASAIAIYKQLHRQDPSLDHVYLKIADIYRQRGFLADAFAQYRILAQYYERLEMKDKALEIMNLMAEMDPQKTALKSRDFNNVIPLPKGEEGAPRLKELTSEGFFDLGAELIAAEPLQMKAFKEVSTLERVYGVKEIFKELKEIGGPSNVDPHFNYNMGVAYWELGLCDEAIEQFEIAVKMRQKPFEALSMLGFCYKENGMWKESLQSFEDALRIEGIPQEKILHVKYILGLLYQERGRIEEALKLLQEIVAVDEGFRKAQDELVRLKGKSGPPDEIIQEVKTSRRVDGLSKNYIPITPEDPSGIKPTSLS